MGGGKAPVMPGPSAAEQALQEEQRKTLELQRGMLEKSMREQELLAPVLYKQLNIKPVTDPEGKITGYEELPNPLKAQSEEIQRLYFNRTQAALEGKLPTDPGLNTSLGEQETQLREQLLRQLGPGYETSTPGIEALAKFNLNKQNILEGARRGDLTLAEQLGLARTASNIGQTQQQFGNVFAIPGQGLPTAQGFGQTAAGFGAGAAAMASDRYAQYQGQLNAYNQQQRTFGQLFGGLGQLAGTLGGAYLFGPAGAAAGNRASAFMFPYGGT